MSLLWIFVFKKNMYARCTLVNHWTAFASWLECGPERDIFFWRDSSPAQIHASSRHAIIVWIYVIFIYFHILIYFGFFGPCTFFLPAIVCGYKLFYWRQGATWSCQIGRGISECRGLMRVVAGPLGDTCWALPWCNILRGWNNEAYMLSDYPGLTTLVCHIHKSSVQIYLLCCNPAVGTVGPLDSGMEHQRTAATCLHLGSWKNIPFEKSLTIGLSTFRHMIIGCSWGVIFLFWCTFHVQNGWPGNFSNFFWLTSKVKGVACGPASFEFDFVSDLANNVATLPLHRRLQRLFWHPLGA